MKISKENVIFGLFLVAAGSAVAWAGNKIYKMNKVSKETVAVLNKK